MNNKKWIIILVTIGLIISSVIIYATYHNCMFVEKNLERYTGIIAYENLLEYHDNSQSFISVKITREEKEKILKKFAFKHDLSELRGRAHCPFICECKDFKYFIMNNSSNPINYVLLALEDNGYTLSVYEAYGN